MISSKVNRRISVSVLLLLLALFCVCPARAAGPDRSSAQPNIVLHTCGGSFDSGHATDGQDELKKIVSGELAPMAYREGYTLIAWTDRSYDTPPSMIHTDYMFAPGDQIQSHDPMTLYALWVPDGITTYYLAYEKNTAQAVLVNIDDTFTSHSYLRQKYFVTAVQYLGIQHWLERDGYLMKGWNTRQDGSGRNYRMNDEVQLEDTTQKSRMIHLYAQWEKIVLPEQYVLFDGNRDLFADGSPYVAVDRSSRFEVPSMEKVGQHVVSWRGQNDNDQIVYSPGDFVLASQNVHVYPEWLNADKQLWHFHVNQGYFDEKFSPDDSPLKPGVNGVAGWAIDGPRLDDTHSYRMIAKTSAEAHSSIAAYEAEIVNNIYYPGYVFAGWNTLPDGNGTHYDAGKIPMNFPGISLYAQWESAEQPYVTFGSNVGQFLPSVSTAKTMYAVPADGTAAAPTEDQCHRKENVLIGWSNPPMGNMYNHFEQFWNYEFYLPGETIPKTENQTYYACWVGEGREPEKKEKAVLYHSNAADAHYAAGNSTIIHAAETTSCCTVFPERSGYRVIGWNTAPNGTGKQYEIGSEIDVQREFPTEVTVHLYAQWEKVTDSGTLENTNLRWSLSESRTLALEGAVPAGSTVWAAAYDADHRLLTIEKIAPGDIVSLPDSAKICKLFVLNQSSAPLCPSPDIQLL